MCAESVHSELSRAASLAEHETVSDSRRCGTVGCGCIGDHGIEYHDPTVTGFNYNSLVTSSSGCIRDSWPPPIETGKHLFTEAIDSRSHFDVSTSDCKKKRELVIGHRERCSLWIWTCLHHSRIAAYHIIQRSEGKRDAICSLYRFKKTAPETVLVDFACHAEETGLNWLPEYYKNTNFLHDIFHSYGHVCSTRFGLKDLPRKPCDNTSLMEQINSFLQPIRGLVASGTTRVSLSYA